MKVKLPQLCWYDRCELELDLPDSWDVNLRRMKGENNPKLSEDEMRAAFDHPIGSDRIRDLAKGKKKIVIIFDDLTRATRTSDIVPFVLEELQLAGIKDNQIRFICALGAHGALSLIEFQKKLGEDITDRFPVYNHNVFENCVPVGTTSYGTPVEINKEVMSCDLKIAIGSIVPHGGTGFGGGSKIILPGVSSMDTIVTNHSQSVHLKNRINIMGAEPKDNLLRRDMDEAAQLAGLDVKIDAILNTWGETTHLFVGDPIEEFYAGVNDVAKEVYATDLVKNADIVIANNYAKANEGMVGMGNSIYSLKEEGGDLVLVAHAPEGQVVHYAGGAFGSESFGRLYVPKTTNPPRVNKLIFFTRFIDRASWGLYAPMENIRWAKTWESVLENLKDNGPEPKVAVYPDLTIQYFPELNHR